jgi:hypothetical protein
VVLVLGGTCRVYVIEGWAFDDAIYMTIITLATVGYGEVHQVSDTGRIFTIILIVLGVGYFMYVVGLFRTISGRRPHTYVILGRRKLDKQIAKLKDHYIVCGYGRIGRVLDALSDRALPECGGHRKKYQTVRWPWTKTVYSTWSVKPPMKTFAQSRHQKGQRADHRRGHRCGQRVS